MQVVQVIIIATAKYIEYAKSAIFSISDFWPDSNKLLYFLCDDVEQGENILESVNDERIVKKKVIKITDLLYPLINLCKPCYIKDYLDEEADYVFYFDSDTEFIKRDNEFWNGIKNVLDTNKILIPISVNCVNSFYPSIYAEGQRGNVMFDTQIAKMYNENEDSPVHDIYEINDSTYLWAMTSCIGAKRIVMKEFAEYYIEFANNLIKRNISQVSYIYEIPKLSDETIINQIIHNSDIGKDTRFLFSIHPYAKQTTLIPVEDFTFMLQKHQGKQFKKHD